MSNKFKRLIRCLSLVLVVLLIAMFIGLHFASKSACECSSSIEMNGDNKCENCGGYLKHVHVPLNGRCVSCRKCVEHVDKDRDKACDNCDAYVAFGKK